MVTVGSPSNHQPLHAPVWRAAALLMAMLAVLVVTTAGVPKARADDRLQFTANLLGGGNFNGASLVGRPAVLWFWTPWCPFCNAEAPGVHQVAVSHPNVAFVGVAAHADPGAMSDFVAKYGLNFPVINDADGAIWARYQVPWQPAYVFYRPDGSSTFVNNPTSAMPESELADRVSALTR